MKTLLLLILISGTLNPLIVFSQISEGGIPYSLVSKNLNSKNNDLDQTIPIIEIPIIKQTEIDKIIQKNKTFNFSHF